MRVGEEAQVADPWSAASTVLPLAGNATKHRETTNVLRTTSLPPLRQACAVSRRAFNREKIINRLHPTLLDIWLLRGVRLRKYGSGCGGCVVDRVPAEVFGRLLELVFCSTAIPEFQWPPVGFSPERRGKILGVASRRAPASCRPGVHPRLCSKTAASPAGTARSPTSSAGRAGW